jgi:hypothetical protein
LDAIVGETNVLVGETNVVVWEANVVAREANVVVDGMGTDVADVDSGSVLSVATIVA